jgi:hypothetical protein
MGANSKFKVFWAVVRLIPIFVMDLFISVEWPPQHFSHDKTVLQFISIVSLTSPCPYPNVAATINDPAPLPVGVLLAAYIAARL